MNKDKPEIPTAPPAPGGQSPSVSPEAAARAEQDEDRKRSFIRQAAEAAAEDAPTTTFDSVSAYDDPTSLAGESAAGPDVRSPSPDEPLGATALPGYRILERISGGGQGAVYLAVQLSVQRHVAVKVLHENSLADLVRFEREVAILGELRHPHVVTVYESGLHNGRPWLAMEYIRGVSLADYVALQRPTLDQKLRLLAQIAAAIHSVHTFGSRGIIHRDLKPTNIIIDEAGEPHILDFGLAKATLDGAPVDDLTQTGQVVGSVPWASPEQACGELARLDARSDVYSLGVIAYQVILGRFPYRVVGSVQEVAQRILTVEPESPRKIDPRLPADLSKLLLTCLAKDPLDRYQTAADLAADLQRVRAGEPIVGRRSDPLRSVRRGVTRGVRQRPVLAGGLVVLLAGLLGNVLGLALFYDWTKVRYFWDALVFPVSPSAADRELSPRVAVISFHLAEAEQLVETARAIDPRIPPVPPGLSADATIAWLRPVHGLLARRLAEACPRGVIFDIAFPTARPQLDPHLAGGLAALRQAGIFPIGYRRTWNLRGVAEQALLGTDEQELSPALVDVLRITSGELLATDTPWRIPVYARSRGAPPQPALAVMGLAELRAPGADFIFEIAGTDFGNALWIHYRNPAGAAGHGGILRESDRIDLIGRWSPHVHTTTGLRPGDEVGLRWLELPPDEVLQAALVPYEWALTCPPQHLAAIVRDKAVLVGAIGPRLDMHRHPDGRLISGVWAQAALLNELLQDTRSIWFTEKWFNLFPALAGALVGFAVAVRFPWSWVRRWGGLVVGAAMLCGLSILILWGARIHVAPLVPIVAAVLACEAGAAVRRCITPPPAGWRGYAPQGA